MLRKLNFTERVKLPRSHVRIALRRQADGYLSFEPTFSFEGIDAPAEARVYVEAYHRTSFMRFDCGSVGQLVMPADRRLTDIDGSSIRFRIKVVDETDNAHRIVAVADDIRVAESAPEAGRRVPLLPVQFTDALEQQAWRIAFEPDSPVLELNNRINGVENSATVEPAGSGGVSSLSATNPRRSGFSAQSGHFAHRRLLTPCQSGDRGPVAEVRNEVHGSAISLRNPCAPRWTGACGRYRAMELASALLFRSALAKKC